MKYIKFFLITVMLLPMLAFAANNKKGKGSSEFHKGTTMLDFTIGTPTSVGPFNHKVIMPPASMVIDACSIDGLAKGKGCISFGGIASYYINDVWGRADAHYFRDYRYDHSYFYFDADQHNIFVAFRSAFHFSPVTKLDIYGGLLMGGHWKKWNYVTGSNYNGYYGEHPTRNKFCFGPFVGVRYFFSKAFGLKAEFGADTGNGMPNAQAGISFKFN
ncbi:MAG: hypothetical protein MJZ19_06800 [Paludibacteraceae bacterium]|nr:hypothetical protein [Paludibacteraceae bacterium]